MVRFILLSSMAFRNHLVGRCQQLSQLFDFCFSVVLLLHNVAECHFCTLLSKQELIVLGFQCCNKRDKLGGFFSGQPVPALQRTSKLSASIPFSICVGAFAPRLLAESSA